MISLSAGFVFFLSCFILICLFLQAICEVSLAQISDVDKAVAAAKEAFEEGEWGKMNPRDRGRLIYRSVLILNTIVIQA